MLHRRHHVALHAPGEGGAHLAEVVRILAVGLLGPAPGRVAEDVDAHAAVEVGADGAELAADRLADALLEIDVPGGAPGHRDREGSGVADDDAAGTVAEREARDAEPLDPGGQERPPVVAARAEVGHPGPERDVAVEAPQALVVGHLGHEAGGGVRDRRAAFHRRDGVFPSGRHGRKACPTS